MPVLTIVPHLEADGFRPLQELLARHPGAGVQDLIDSGDLIHLSNDAEVAVGALDHGTAAGRPSVMFCFTLPDGRVVLAETTLALLLTAADTLKALYGDPRT